MQAIQTKILPATNSKPTRVKAICARGSAVFSWFHPTLGDCARDEEKHRKAASLLCEKFASEGFKEYGSDMESNPWLRGFVSGTLPNGDYVHVFLS